jgi:hypothetical protein
MKHKTLLQWMIYLNVAVVIWVVAYWSGLLQIVIAHDHSYMSRALLALYVMAEICNAVQIFRVDLEIASWEEWKQPWSVVRFDNYTDTVLIGDWLSERIAKIGMLATVVGIVWALWPFLQGASIEQIKNNLSPFFSGVAVAFIPTAVSFAAVIMLDIPTKILTKALQRLEELV